MTKKPVKKAAKPAKKIDMKKTINAAKNVAKKVGASAKLVPIIPLVPAMKAILISKKIKPENDIEKLCIQFRNEVIKKGKKFDTVHKNLVDDVVTIVKEIIGFFAQAKAKKDLGKGLTNDEMLANVEGEKAAAKLPTKGTDINPTFILGGAMAIFLVVVMMKSKK